MDVTISDTTLEFLRDLRENNYREWFQENKSRYISAREEFEKFVDALLGKMSLWEPDVSDLIAKKVTFRIYRDTRFSKDKTPYKTHLGANITPQGKRSDVHSSAGYYFHIGPGESMLAGGAYGPKGEWIKDIRSRIDSHPQELKDILNRKEYQQYFGGLDGEKLKTAPKGYKQDHPEIELLRHKSFLAVHRCDDQTVTGDDFLSHSDDVFRAMKPLIDFLQPRY